MNKVAVADWSKLTDRAPAYALVANVDLVVIRYGDKASVLYGRCLHRGALLADGFVDGDNLICGLHNWDYRIDTGISEYNNAEVLPKFNSLDRRRQGPGRRRTRSRPGRRSIRSPTSATTISGSMPTCTAIRSSRTSG